MWKANTSSILGCAHSGQKKHTCTRISRHIMDVSGALGRSKVPEGAFVTRHRTATGKNTIADDHVRIRRLGSNTNPAQRVSMKQHTDNRTCCDAVSVGFPQSPRRLCLGWSARYVFCVQASGWGPYCSRHASSAVSRPRAFPIGDGRPFQKTTDTSAWRTCRAMLRLFRRIDDRAQGRE